MEDIIINTIGKEQAKSLVQGFFGGWVKDETYLKELYNIQEGILESLLPDIPSFTITDHQEDEDEPGACLYGVFGNYSIEVSIEDNERLEDVDYYAVSVIDLRTMTDEFITKHDQYVFHSGVVFDRDEIISLSKLCVEDDIKSIIALIYRKYCIHSWVDTPEHVIEKLQNQALIPHYTTSVSIISMIYGHDE